MSAPDGRQMRGHGLVVVREHAPDPDRCIAAVIKLLTWATEAERQAAAPAEPTPTPTTPACRASAAPNKELPPSDGAPGGKGERSDLAD